MIFLDAPRSHAQLGHTILQLLPSEVSQRYSQLSTAGSWSCGAISTSLETGVVAVASDGGDVFLLQPFGFGFSSDSVGGSLSSGGGRDSIIGEQHDSSLRLLHCLDSEGPVRLLAWSNRRASGACGLSTLRLNTMNQCQLYTLLTSASWC